jgi:hypothetical protein
MADMQFKDKFFACLSLGERTYRTDKSDKCVLFASTTFTLSTMLPLPSVRFVSRTIHVFAALRRAPRIGKPHMFQPSNLVHMWFVKNTTATSCPELPLPVFASNLK